MKQIYVNINIIVLFLSVFLVNCQNPQTTAVAETPGDTPNETADIIVGAARTDLYFPLIKEKKIALMVNQTSTLGEEHLVDRLVSEGIDIAKIFAPEHGFRGTADAGEKLEDGKDPTTGIDIVSLYGKKRKPSTEDLQGIELVIFDIQDVGARFYTYISSMHYIMEACAENNIQFLVLDRPNPNGHYVDGPILDTANLRSFVGMHPIPTVHGMTVGEYAKMVNGQGWLSEGIQCKLMVIPCENYTHNRTYELPIKPSPNLPNQRSIYLYPSICFFEGTVFSLGRGTTTQFQVIGAPAYPDTSFSFVPIPRPGAKYPKHEGKTCYGLDLTVMDPEDIHQEGKLNLSYLLKVYEQFPDKDNFFLASNFFDKLAGNEQLKQQMINGVTEQEIRDSWEPGLSNFKKMRQQYLLYE